MHFTYEKPSGEDLQQGDLLQRTAEINELLERVHPHYHGHPDYRYLLVLTQSCDLVRRDDGVKSRYITLAAVRPLSTVIRRELTKHQRTPREVQANYCRAGGRDEMRRFLERLFNNNEPGYFYLHSDLELAIEEHTVAFLTLSIAVKSEPQYVHLVAARVARLRPEFQAKLGWLVGNLYSRVGTPDWVPENMTADLFKERIDEELSELCLWVDERGMKKLRDHDAAQSRANPAFKLTEADAREVLERLANDRETTRGKLVDRVDAVLREVTGPDTLDEHTILRLRTRLMNDQQLSQLLR